ncbi:hypothetical protein AB0912_29925 [Streptomyces sp. NPDC007084]|uniref:hypothetical protein n=1 Tax=Streptomyces sp. NPDC007084 TaxID=3154313 RepID=UPI0034550684
MTAVLAAVAGLGLAALPGTAHAADVKLSIDAQDTYYAYQYGEGPPGDGDLFLLELNLSAPDGIKPLAKNVKLTIDATELDGKAIVTGDGGACTHKAYVYTCAYTSIDGQTSVQPFYIKGAKGTKPGTSGDIHYTATSTNAGTATATTHAIIGGPKLLTQREKEVTGVTPGGAFDITPAIANAGPLAAPQGIGVKLFGEEGLKVAEQYSNCHYRPMPQPTAYCTFDTPIEPGTAYAFDKPWHFTTSDDLMYATVDYLTWPLGSGNPWEYDNPGDYTVTGSGPALGLKPVPASGFPDFGGFVEVSTTQRADYRAIGGEVTGKVGQTVPVTLGVKNDGPGSMNLYSRPGQGSGTYRVTPPEGTVITKIPFPGEEDDHACGAPLKGTRTYECEISDIFPAGDTSELTFYVRIQQAVAHPKPGSVEAAGRTDFPNRDDHPQNDSAPVTLKITGGTSTASPSPSPSGSTSASPSASASPSTGASTGGSANGGAGTSGGTNPQGGSMASTGTGSLPWIGAAAVAALGAGAAGVAVSRRRRHG